MSKKKSLSLAIAIGGVAAAVSGIVAINTKIGAHKADESNISDVKTSPVIPSLQDALVKLDDLRKIPEHGLTRHLNANEKQQVKDAIDTLCIAADVTEDEIIDFLYKRFEYEIAFFKYCGRYSDIEDFDHYFEVYLLSKIASEDELIAFANSVAKGLIKEGKKAAKSYLSSLFIQNEGDIDDDRPLTFKEHALLSYALTSTGLKPKEMMRRAGEIAAASGYPAGSGGNNDTIDAYNPLREIKNSTQLLYAASAVLYDRASERGAVPVV